MTVTMSIGVEVAACMDLAPARRAPSRKAAATTPAGFALPSRARAMASNPYPEEKPGVRLGEMLASWTAPANPARAPESAITVTNVRAGLMPAVRAASGLAPTALNSNPTVVRLRSHATRTAIRIASSIPAFRRRS